jgi:UDP-N-acetylmuramyl pentapeptide synthase
MKIIKEIYCVNKDKDGVIVNVGVINEKLNEKGQKTYFSKKKEDFIKEIRDLEKKGDEVEIKTTEGTKVHIVKEKYLRTDGDQSKDNDLLDLKECK